MANALSSQQFIITTQAIGRDVTFKHAFNCYRRPSDDKSLNYSKSGIILFLSHGGGHHKEMWEPFISGIFRLDDDSPSPQIIEAWACDGLNHGDTAALNQDVLKDEDSGPVYESGEAYAALYKTKFLGTLNPHIHKIVIIGHSAGAVIVVLATTFFKGLPTEVPFSSIILVEPAMVPIGMQGQETSMYHMVKQMTPGRRDVWESKEAAKAWMKKRIPWSLWDTRVLDIYVEHGLTSLPTASYPDKTGVTLKASKTNEAKVFQCLTEADDAVHRLDEIATTVPIHFIFGGREELYPPEVQNALSNPAQGRPATISRISGTGHLIVQEVPDKLAEHIYTILTEVENRRCRL